MRYALSLLTLLALGCAAHRTRVAEEAQFYDIHERKVALVELVRDRALRDQLLAVCDFRGRVKGVSGWEGPRGYPHAEEELREEAVFVDADTLLVVDEVLGGHESYIVAEAYSCD